KGTERARHPGDQRASRLHAMQPFESNGQTATAAPKICSRNVSLSGGGRSLERRPNPLRKGAKLLRSEPGAAGWVLRSDRRRLRPQARSAPLSAGPSGRGAEATWSTSDERLGRQAGSSTEAALRQ